MAKTKLQYFNKVMRNLDKEIQAIQGRTLEGLINAVIIIQRESEPMVPIDTNNLRISFFTVTSKGDASEIPAFTGPDASLLAAEHASLIAEAKQIVTGKNPVVMFGYSAGYAVFVHESVDTVFKRPGAQAKFLQKAIIANKSKLLETIASKAKIK